MGPQEGPETHSCRQAGAHTCKRSPTRVRTAHHPQQPCQHAPCGSAQGVVLLFSRSVVSDSLQPHGLYPARLPCPWDSPGKNSGVGCHFLLQVMSWKRQNCGDREEPRGHAGREPGGAGGRARGRGYVTTRVCQNSGWHAKGIPRMDVMPQFLRRLKTRSKSPTVYSGKVTAPRAPRLSPRGGLFSVPQPSSLV